MDKFITKKLLFKLKLELATYHRLVFVEPQKKNWLKKKRTINKRRISHMYSMCPAGPNVLTIQVCKTPIPISDKTDFKQKR